MRTSFNARLSSKEKIIASAILFSLISWIHPGVSMAFAETGQEKDLIFEINSDQIKILENQNSLKNQIAIENTHKKVNLLREYLEKKNAPLADYTEILLAQEDWKMILAISNAESNMGKRCYHYNCSGIYARYDRGYAGLKKYENYAQWIVDLQALLDRRYEGWSLDRMNGVYVHPRSANWYKATTKIHKELTELEKQFPAHQA